MNKKQDKEKLRKKYLNIRKKIYENYGQKKSDEIKLNLFELKNIKKAKNIMVYISYRSEVVTDDITDELLVAEKNIYVPYCIVDEKKMKIVKISNPAQDLETGAYGILEPRKNLREEEVSPEKLDIVVVPAVAFSDDGYRVGYGGGYYDRFLGKLSSETTTIGITYDELLFDELPREEHDLPVDMIVTDKKVITCN